MTTYFEETTYPWGQYLYNFMDVENLLPIRERRHNVDHVTLREDNYTLTVNPATDYPVKMPNQLINKEWARTECQ